MRPRILRILFMLAFCIPHSMSAQQEAPAAAHIGPATTYKLTFVVREMLAGKVTGSRSYSSLLAGTNNQNSIRAGSRVPIVSGKDSRYFDLGANFDFRQVFGGESLGASSNQLGLFIRADITALAEDKSSTGDPVIRQNRWETTSLIVLNKPTLLFSSDDPTLDRTTQVELTVTKLP